ncbi:efflux RND transporter permease subunit [Desulfoluna spongiiphila]|uniref:Multidrug efflux pump subunit AcrB n=1 Tax=Desulfoluna spongiiphila TaxID=419481 RepID=A0A1G5AF94_9BACT|nr:efflux RND transporter permease subunit [Desulfoluna spongiiphila]SCX76548.1 Multidrug efflux pump subunit AcrB [Desulfoluna spongiiphila]
MITRFAIKNSVLVYTVLGLLFLSGVTIFNSLPRDDMPPFLIRTINVVTTYPGASPERVVNLITDRIEKAVQEVPEVDYITSESRTGISIININLLESTMDLQPIFDRIRRKVEAVEPELPDGSQVRVDDELGDVFGIILGLIADGYSAAELSDLADDVRDELIKLPASAKVEIQGAQEERIYVSFSNERLAAVGLSKNQLQEIISGTNIVVPGGDILADGRRIILEPTGNFQSLEDLSEIVVASSGGRVLKLGDIADITRGYTDPRESIVKINGREGLAIGVNLMHGGNILALGSQVDAKVDELLKSLPYGVEIFRVASQDTVVAKSVNDFTSNLVQAVVIVLLTMLAFLGLRTGLVVASLIPATMVTTLLLMSFAGVGLNKVSLASLIIALGMLVDNAIVMSESIMVKMEGGDSPVDAAVDSAKELTVPLLTSSLTTSAAFMAFWLAESVMGEIMGQIFVVLTIALICSWLLTLSMVALLCIKAIRVTTEGEKETLFTRFAGRYRKALELCLRRPWLTIGGIVMVFVVCMGMFRFIPFIFMPPSDRPLVTVNVELPMGTDIQRTQEIVSGVNDFIQKNMAPDGNEGDGVVSWSTYTGEGAPKYDLGYVAPEASPNNAHILINTTSDEASTPVIAALETYFLSTWPDAKYKVSRLVSGGGSADPVAIRVIGNDAESLYRISESVKAELAKIPGATNISDDWGMLSKKLVVKVDPIKSQMAGLTNQDIAVALETELSGSTTGSYREGEDVIPIIMRENRSGLLTVEEIEGLSITSRSTGKSIPLTQVAEINTEWQSGKILRRDLNVTQTITCDVREDTTASDVIKAVTPWLDEAQATWPSGTRYELGGDAEGSSKAMGAVVAKLPWSGVIIVLLLIWQFNSLKKPLIILLTIPLGLIGVIIGMLITGSYFGFMAFLGVISLAGIVINNAIVLLDRIRIEEEELKKEPAQAIVDAACQRFRPILLTTATTSLGLLPLWLGGGIMWEPMAISILFGLLFSTVLTLVFVPVMYSRFYGVNMK